MKCAHLTCVTHAGGAEYDQTDRGTVAIIRAEEKIDWAKEEWIGKDRKGTTKIQNVGVVIGKCFFRRMFLNPFFPVSQLQYSKLVNWLGWD